MGVNTASEAMHLDPRQRLLITDITAMWASVAASYRQGGDATAAHWQVHAGSASCSQALSTAGLGVYTGLAGKVEPISLPPNSPLCYSI